MADIVAPDLPAPVVNFGFHLKPAGAVRANDERENTEFLEWGQGGMVPIPDVGDTVSYTSWKATGPGPGHGEESIVVRKIESRHFYVHQDRITIYFVVTDVADDELRAPPKE